MNTRLELILDERLRLMLREGSVGITVQLAPEQARCIAGTLIAFARGATKRQHRRRAAAAVGGDHGIA